MDPLITSLINAGGLGLLAAILLLLRRESLKAFREELAAEREQSQRESDRHYDDRQRKHEVLAAEIRRIGNTIASVRDRGCGRQLPLGESGPREDQ